MDFLNKAFAQLSDLFRSMTPGGRITTGLLLVVAVVSVGYLFQHQASGGDEYLFGGAAMQTPTLQKMEEAFGKAGLNGFSMEGGRVKVPHAQRAAYLAALADHQALPPNSGEAFKAATDGGLWDLPDTSKRKFNVALQEEMSRVIGKMKGIEWALVIIDTQPQSGFGPPLKTASVAVQAIGGVPLDYQQVKTIRYYVAAVGMKPKNVTIADLNGPVYPGDDVDGRGPDGNPFNRAAREAEQALNAKVRETLAYIPNVTVTSTMTFDHGKGSRSLEANTDPKSANREAATSGGATEIQTQGGANQPASLGAGGNKASNETGDESKIEQVNVVNTTTAEKDSFGGTAKKATVSVGIPASYYEKVWKEQNPTNEGEEAKKLDRAAVDKIREKITQDVRNQVATILSPLAPDVKDAASLVTVTTFQDFKPAEIQVPPPAQRALTWLGQNWPMTAMVGLVLFSLGMLRSMFRSIPAESAAASMRATAPSPKSQASDEPAAAAVARRPRRTAGTGPALRDELSELVKGDPDSAANILRSWIGQGS